MKRLLAISLAVAMVAMFAGTAMADFSMGIMSYTDIGYIHQNDDRTGTGSDKTSAFVDEAHHSRLYGKFSNENMSGYLEIGMGDNDSTYAKSNRAENVNFRKLYGDYKIGNLTITAGHTEPLGAARYNASQLLGLEQGHIIMMGFGNLYQRTTQVNLEYRAGILYLGVGANGTNWIGLQGQEYAPTWAWTGVAGIRTKMVWATLGGMIAYNATDDEPAGADDSVTAWEINLPIDLKFGMLEARIHPYYGQNVANLGYGFMDAANKVQIDAAGKTEDTDCYGGYVDVTIGGDPFELHLIGGISIADNDLYEKEQQRWGLVARGAWKVAKNFTLSPEFGYYDYGKNTADTVDLGSEWLAGFQFQFIF